MAALYRKMFLPMFLVIVPLAGAVEKDWLVEGTEAFAQVIEKCWPEYGDQCGLELSNGLLRRRFVTTPAFGTIDFEVQSEGGWRSVFRAVEPEAVISLDGRDVAVGGLASSTVRAYCNRTEFFETLYAETALAYVEYRVTMPVAPYPWTAGSRHSNPETQWPPPGRRLEIDFENDGMEATVIYELYDGAPVLTKSVQVRHFRGVIDRIDVELVAANPGFGAYYGGRGPYMPGFDDDGAPSTVTLSPLLHAKTDVAYGFQCAWTDDGDASGAVEPLLNCSATIGVSSNGEVTTGRTILLGLDSPDIERQSLARHRVTALLAPQTTESPIFFHYAPTTDDLTSFKRVVDEMVDVGFDMLVMSFGSPFNLENTTSEYLNEVAEKVAYANSFGIEVGGYDLIVRDRGPAGYGGNAGNDVAVVTADGETLGEDACFASQWVDRLEADVVTFLDRTNLSMLECDGPYGGVPCFSKNHSYHRDSRDSIFRQHQLQSEFFKKLRGRKVYINTPDEYLYQGANRAAMGYSEDQYSLPAWEDLTISRMGLYDDLYFRLPTAGWMFAPLTVYHGGGEAAIFEDKPRIFDWALAQYLGAGTSACYRGDRLFDNTTETGKTIRQSLKFWVQQFFQPYRSTLTKPIIHLRRPDLQSWDGWLHVNPMNDASDIAIALIFNPTTRILSDVVIPLPLYYAGACTSSYGVVDVILDGRGPAQPMTLLPRSRHHCAISVHMSSLDALSVHTIIVLRHDSRSPPLVDGVAAQQ